MTFHSDSALTNRQNIILTMYKSYQLIKFGTTISVRVLMADSSFSTIFLINGQEGAKYEEENKKTNDC